MAALLALGYSMLLQAQEEKGDAADHPTDENHPPQPDMPVWASALGQFLATEPTPTATPDLSASSKSLPQPPTLEKTLPQLPALESSSTTKSSRAHRSSAKGDGDGESSRKGSSKRHKIHNTARGLDEQYEKQMAKVARLMRKMARAEQRERNARWKAAMQDITLARAAGIDPQNDKVSWADDSDEEDSQHPVDASLKKPVTDLSAKPADSDVPAAESGDTLARFIHAMFSSMNPFEEATQAEAKEGDVKADVATSQAAETQKKPNPNNPKDQQADAEVLRLLSSASTMNQASHSRGSVWNVLDLLTPGRSKKSGRNDAEGSVMFSAPLFITEDSKVEVAQSEMRVVEDHEPDSEDAKPNSSKFANLVTRMGMDGMFGKKKSTEAQPAEAEVAVEAKVEPEQPKTKEVRVWRPSSDGISLQCSWWGYRIYLPPPVIAVLSDQKLEAANRAALVTTALQWIIDHVPTAVLPPQVGLVMSLIRGIIPALGYIGGFVAWSWNAIIGFDQGSGVILSATWLLPIALIPGAWDIEPVQVPEKRIELEPAAEVKESKPPLSRSASIAKKLSSLSREASVKSSHPSSKELKTESREKKVESKEKKVEPKEKKPERKVVERSTTAPMPMPKRSSEPVRQPSLAGPLPTPPSSVPRTSSKAGSRSSTPPVTKVKEPKPDSDRPTLKKSTSKIGLNIVWSDKLVNEEPKAESENESVKKSSNFKLPMPEITWEHERKAAEAEAAAKLAAEHEARAAAKVQLKSKYAQALREEMAKDKGPVGWSLLS